MERSLESLTSEEFVIAVISSSIMKSCYVRFIITLYVCQLALLVKNWRILFDHSLLPACPCWQQLSTFGL